MDAKLYNSICISASILKMGIPLQYHAIVEHIMKTHMDNHTNLNAVDSITHKFPMTGSFKVFKYGNDYLILYDEQNRYYFYTNGEDILYIVSKEESISQVVYDFLIDKENDIKVKKQISEYILLTLFGIKVKVNEYDQESEIYDMIYNDKYATYHYKFKILDKGYCTLTLIDRVENKYGTAEICNKIS